jgi:hypothetical protein
VTDKQGGHSGHGFKNALRRAAFAGKRGSAPMEPQRMETR